ncbi:hypothetical protein M407DRAFT_17817 [Tulasnella calospora MUT 4182]|uniref:F-box domain-containing protein n=1 Tax=Tulasnella calospora MUT 4182 TaxID=1051891 RepID=A0A0C3LH15_9AGAM|nr:hypothetical protein M407DRAFT_17817 [Tulasnella calospora MUT 4182]
MVLLSVREVSIWRVSTSRALFHYFQRCPRLERLTLINVSMIDSTETTPISLESLKYLLYRPISTLRAINSLPTLILPKLKTLLIGSILLSGSADSFQHQVFRFDRSVLTELSIGTYTRVGAESMEAGLVELLKRADGIRSLSLDEEPKFKSSLAADLIPELEAFRGRPDNVLVSARADRSGKYSPGSRQPNGD